MESTSSYTSIDSFLYVSFIKKEKEAIERFYQSSANEQQWIL